MSALSIQPAYPIFTDVDGQPLENGYIWVGAANLDPQTNPINVYWDAALTQLAVQPIRTLAGYPVNSGTPARLYVNSDYSIRVLDKKGNLVYSAPTATERYGNIITASDIAFTGFKGQAGTLDDLADADGADWIGFTPSSASSIARSVQDKEQDWVSVFDFMTEAQRDDVIAGTLLLDVTAAIQAAQAAVNLTGGTLLVPPGKYLTSGDCGNGSGTSTTRVHVLANGAEFHRAATTSAYNMFSFRQNMTIEGLKLKGYIDSGTGWADVVPAGSFGFRAATNTGSTLFINCEADGLPYDGWYIGQSNARVELINCIGKECYRNDFAATDAKSVVIEGGNFGYTTGAITKVAAIDIEPGTLVGYVSVKNLTSYHRIDFWAANGNIRHAIIDGVTMQDSNALLSWYRVRQMDVGEIKFNGSADFDRAGVPTVQSGAQYLPNGSFKRLPNVKSLGPNLIANPYNSTEGFTQSSGGTSSATPNYPIADKKGIQVTNTGGGYRIYYQTITVSSETWYTLGGLMQYNSGSGGESGFYIAMPTFGFAEIYLQPNIDTAGTPQFICAAVKIPAGVTSIRVGFGSSGGTRDQAFTDTFFCKGIIGEGAIDVPMITYANSAPTTGTWAVGDRVVRATPVIGQPKAWVCTVAGTPGTWVSEGNL